MMPGQDGIDDLGQHGVFVTVQAMKQGLALFHFAKQVLAQFLAHAALRHSFFRPLTAAKFAKTFRQRIHEGPRYFERRGGVTQIPRLMDIIEYGRLRGYFRFRG